MSEKFADWMRQRMKEKKVSQVALAERLGVSTEMIRLYLKGATPRMDKVPAIASALGVSGSDLLEMISGDVLPEGEEGEEGGQPECVDSAHDKPEMSAIISVGKNNFTGDLEPRVLDPLPLVVPFKSASGLGMEFRELINSYIAVDRYHLRIRSGANHTRVVIMRATGDHMEDTISPGDEVAIVRHDNEPLHIGGIYAFHKRRSFMLSRIIDELPGGKLMIKGDNPARPSREIDPDDINDWRIMGRVNDVSKLK